MRLKKEFITHDADGESLLVPTGAAGWSGLVRGNKTFGAMLELLGEETTEEATEDTTDGTCGCGCDG